MQQQQILTFEFHVIIASIGRISYQREVCLQNLSLAITVTLIIFYNQHTKRMGGTNELILITLRELFTVITITGEFT